MKNLFYQFYYLTKGKAFKQTSIVYLSQAFQAIAGFIISILLIRHLPVDEYGALSVFSSAYMLLAGLSHWGWTETFVRFGSTHSGSENRPALEKYFRKKLLFAAAVTSLIFLISIPFLTKYFYHREEWNSLLYLAAITGFFTCFFSFEMNRIRAHQKFKLYFGINFFGSFFRLTAVAGALFFSALYLNSIIFVYLSSPLLCIALIYFLLPYASSNSYRQIDSETVAETRKYNKWIVVSILATTAATNMDMHIVAYFTSNESLAKLGASSRLTLPISILVSSLTTTILPKLSEHHQNAEVIKFYLRKMKSIIPLLSILFLICGSISVPVLAHIAGSKYAGLEHIIFFQIVAILVVLITNPFGLIVLAKGKTKETAIMNICQVLLGIILHLILVPKLGVIGSVYATIGMNLLGLLVTMQLVKRIMSQL